MGVFYELIPPHLIEWIRDQPIFWVATAPLSGAGHVNVSPKGGPYFGVLDERTFWYLDLTGSGSETISHLYEPGNGRITVQFNAFVGAPKIVRLFGKGRVLEIGSPEFETFVEKNKVELLPGVRSVIVVDIHQVGSSCGYSVPFMDFKAHRPVLNDYFAKKEARFKAGKTEDSMDRYWALKNAWSVDALPGMKRGLKAGREEKVEPGEKMVGPNVLTKYRKTPESTYTLLDLLLVAVFCLMVGTFCGFYGKPAIKRLANSAFGSAKSSSWDSWLVS